MIAELIVSNNTNFQNISFTDIEGGDERVDTTIGYNSSITYEETMPEGEGRLYRVAPVIKYGGKLCYNETVPDGTTLYDNMIIQNGATLTIAGIYTANADIIIINGSIVTTGNGNIRFQGGHKLIIEGTASVYGTPSHKLTFDFVTPNENGIVINHSGSLTITNCKVIKAETGVFAELYADYLNAQYVEFEDCELGSVTILGNMYGGETPPPQIKYCTITNSEYGISVSNLSTITIQNNTITNTDLGIFLSNVASPVIYANVISSIKYSMAGIFLESSSGGSINLNTISGHTNGIHLGNSSPDIGGNVISDNKYHGIYIGAGSLPNMEQNLAGSPPNVYPLSGYNDIKENGGTTTGGPMDNDGSEIFFFNSNAILEDGCNAICDDRSPGGEHPPYNTKLLMNGFALQQIELYAGGNYWCDNPLYPLEERFGNLSVHLDPVLPGPCEIPQGGGEDFLVMKSFSGEVIDTFYSVPAAIPELTETELKYAEAEEYFITADYVNANLLYQEIINSQATAEEKYKAQIRKYEIGKLTDQSPEFFEAMGTTFETIAVNTTDSLTKKIFSQLSTLCLVGEEEYLPAIGEFDEIIQQNPNSEEAVYAEIDAITTALLVEGDSTLGKGRLGKYLVKTGEDYLNKLDGILKKHFGNQKEETEEELLPKEYTLYQNYPNPFNPVTTIKYDLPNASEVSLIIYDILGRRVKMLVNEHQQPGRYESKFDASSLASGIYIYQLVAEDYVSTKKMILLK